MTVRKASLWVIFWISMAVIFNIGIYSFLGPEKAIEFLGGYVIELSLSLDNLFLFLLIFESFAILPQYRRRVLNYGLIGAIVLRLIFVLLGVAIVNKFHWILYIFGLILIISGVKMMFQGKEEKDFSKSRLIKLLNRIIPVSKVLHEEKFFVREKGILYATPLLAILVLIEGTDIIFAIDSIPAIFAITTDPLIVYSSNVFAILGLRSMYFLLEKVNATFKYVKYGVALILTYTGIKLSVMYFHIKIPTSTSLMVIFGIIIVSIIASVICSRNKSCKREKL